MEEKRPEKRRDRSSALQASAEFVSFKRLLDAMELVLDTMRKRLINKQIDDDDDDDKKIC